MASTKKSSPRTMATKKRPIDKTADEVVSWWGKSFTFVKKTKIKSWQASLVLTFLVGGVLTIIWAAKTNYHDSSDAAGEGTSNLTFSATTPVTVRAGDTFSVNALVTPGTGESVDSVDVRVQYSNADLQLDTITNTSSVFQSVLINSINANAGTGIGIGRYAAGTLGSYVTTANSVIATFNFTSLRSGTSSLSFTSASKVVGVVGGVAGIVTTGTLGTSSITILSADTTGPTFTVVDGTSATTVKTDTINITVADVTGVASRFYGFSTDNVCNASDTITTAFASGTNFSIAGDHTDYLCVKATDSVTPTANVSYQLIGQLHTDNTAPVITMTSPATSSSIRSITTASAVSYSLSETVASGTIAFTRTGGTADGTVHTCTLRGTALNSGAHNNLDLSDTTNACSAVQTLVNGAIYTVTFNAADVATNVATAVSRTGVTYDTTAPTISQVTPVTTPTNDTTPDYIFTTNEAGTIAYSGDCSSSKTTATSGSNTVTFNALSAGLHNNCTISVTDGAGNQSSPLSVSSFIIDTTAPTISQVTPVTTPTNDTTPDYIFTTNEAGTIAYSGDCSSSKTTATSGSNTVTFNTLTSAIHSNCTIRVTDVAGNQSTSLALPSFMVDANAPTGGSISLLDGFNSNHIISLTISDGTDALSGINTGSRLIQRRAATLITGACGSYGSWSTITPTVTFPSLVDTTVATAICYQYQYIVSDNVGNNATYANSNTAKITYKSDISLNGVVDISDFSLLKQNFDNAVCGNIADITGDCMVDISDFSMLHDEFDQTVL